jgi:hypothetical protein
MVAVSAAPEEMGAVIGDRALNVAKAAKKTAHPHRFLTLSLAINR